MKNLHTFEEFLNESTEINEALNQGKTRELSHKILTRLIDMDILKPKEKTEALVEEVSAIILNFR